MVKYICIFCKKEVPHELVKNRVKCPYCGNKILVKQRPKKVKIVKAI